MQDQAWELLPELRRRLTYLIRDLTSVVWSYGHIWTHMDTCGIQTDGHIWSYRLMDTYGVMD